MTWSNYATIFLHFSCNSSQNTLRLSKRGLWQCLLLSLRTISTWPLESATMGTRYPLLCRRKRGSCSSLMVLFGRRGWTTGPLWTSVCVVWGSGALHFGERCLRRGRGLRSNGSWFTSGFVTQTAGNLNCTWWCSNKIRTCVATPGSAIQSHRPRQISPPMTDYKLSRYSQPHRPPPDSPQFSYRPKTPYKVLDKARCYSLLYLPAYTSQNCNFSL